jgi:hypothetical protein
MAAGFREGFVETDGVRTRYMEAGEGPALARAGTSAIGALRPPPIGSSCPVPFGTSIADPRWETP